MLLEGKKGLVINVTNKNSLGWAIADAANRHGARVGVGGQNERMRDGVRKLIQDRSGFDEFQIDFAFEDQYAKLAERVDTLYGRIDFLVHSVGFAPKEAMEGRYIDTTHDDFMIAMNASCYSFTRLCKAMEPFIADDGAVVTLSYLGSERAVKGYNVMGVCKAALESSVRYLAQDLGGRGIRVNTLSPGPVNTVAARGVPGLREMIDAVHERAPLKRDYAQPEVSGSAIYLLSDLSRGVTGQVVYVDSGYNVVGF